MSTNTPPSIVISKRLIKASKHSIWTCHSGDRAFDSGWHSFGHLPSSLLFIVQLWTTQFLEALEGVSKLLVVHQRLRQMSQSGVPLTPSRSFCDTVCRALALLKAEECGKGKRNKV